MKKLISAMLAVLMVMALCAAAFASGEASDELFAPMTFPEDAKIVSATRYTVYTKSPSSLQDAVIKATLYWDLTNDAPYAIRFLQPMLPWDDNGASMGWACVADEDLRAELEAADALVGVEDGVDYAKYLSIGGVVWTGGLGSDPAADVAVVYTGEIDGQTVALGEYVRSEEGAEWYVDAAMQPAYFLTDDAPSEASGEPENAASAYTITYKENNGHGVYFWMSDITFPGNMEAIKEFVMENGFDYDYYADGGITKNDDGFWQTADAVSGATLDETPTYLDILKTLYNDIQAGDYVEEN